MRFEQITTRNNNIFDLCKTNKFKSNTIILTFACKTTRKEITTYRLLAAILRYSNNKYKTTKALSSQQELLYNTKVGTSFKVYSEDVIFCFSLKFVDPKYFEDSQYTYNKVFSFFTTYLTPYLNKEKNAFNQKIFKMCKENYANELEKLDEDKESYAFLKILEMVDDPNIIVNNSGSLNDLNDITSEECYRLFLRIIKGNLNIFAIGNFRQSSISKQIDKHFSNYNIRPNYLTCKKVNHQAKLIIKEEEKKLSQSVLALSYTSKILKTDKEYLALQVFNGIFGSYSTSKLFRVIREKKGYCYNISSFVDFNTGLIFVLTSINQKNFSDVFNLINQQLESIRNGLISKKELKFVKTKLIAELLTIPDSQIEYAFYHLEGVLLRYPLTIQENINIIEAITIEDIIKVAQNIQVKDCYFLKQGDKNE